MHKFIFIIRTLNKFKYISQIRMKSINMLKSPYIENMNRVVVNQFQNQAYIFIADKESSSLNGSKPERVVVLSPLHRY